MSDIYDEEQLLNIEETELTDGFPFLEITSIDNAIDNLEMMVFILQTHKTLWRWKWCVIAAHQALYSFTICALEGTAPILTVTERDIRNYPKVSPIHIIGACHAWHVEGSSNAEILDKLDSIAMASGNYSVNNQISEATIAKWLTKRPQLIGIREALRRLTANEPNTGVPFSQDRNDYLLWSHSKRLVLSSAETEAIDSLIADFRNEFEHYMPKSWLIHPDIFPPMLTYVLRVIRFIALGSNNVNYHEDDHEDRVTNALDKIERFLSIGAL